MTDYTIYQDDNRDRPGEDLQLGTRWSAVTRHYAKLTNGSVDYYNTQTSVGRTASNVTADLQGVSDRARG